MTENMDTMSDKLEKGTQILMDKKGSLKLFSSFAGEVMGTSTLDMKYKALIAAAIALYAGCKHCMIHHIREAVNLGANRKELIDTMEVAILMGGGVCWASSATFFQDAIDHCIAERDEK